MKSVSSLIASCVALATLATAVAAASVQDNWEKNCTDCHGQNGKSQTRLGRKAGAPDLTDPKRQAMLTDEDAFRGIKFGRKNSKGEEKMDAFGQVLSDKEITELVAFVRTLAK